MHTNKTAKTLESSFHLQNSADKLQYIMSNDDILFRQEQVQLVTKQMKPQYGRAAHKWMKNTNDTGKCLQIFAWRMVL